MGYSELTGDPAPGLYDDVSALGGLKPAVQDALTRHGSSLRATDLDVKGFPAYCRVGAVDRFSQVYMAKDERLFLVDFWEKGVCLADASTPSLPELARFLHDWNADRHSLGRIGVRPKPGAQSFIDGTEIEDRWAVLLRDEPISPKRPLLPFLIEAAKEPILRNLFPYTSMMTLCFSRCTGYPYTYDCPVVTPLGAGQYRVADRAQRTLGEGTAAEAVHIVLRHLPPGCDRAVKGTAHNLGDS
jgi:hypothetical protein